MKRAACTVILLSMILHFASRSGFISYLYSNRHDIAYSIGLIAEIPIAECKSDYFSKEIPLTVYTSDDQDHPSPSPVSQAREINLFVEALPIRHLDDIPGSDLQHYTVIPEAFFDSPLLSIFHPPCEPA